MSPSWLPSGSPIRSPVHPHFSRGLHSMDPLDLGELHMPMLHMCCWPCQCGIGPYQSPHPCHQMVHLYHPMLTSILLIRRCLNILIKSTLIQYKSYMQHIQ